MWRSFVWRTVNIYIYIYIHVYQIIKPLSVAFSVMVPFLSNPIGNWLDNQTLLNRYYKTPKIRVYMGLYRIKWNITFHCTPL